MTGRVLPLKPRPAPPGWHPSMRVVRHDDRAPEPCPGLLLLTVQLPVSLALYRDLVEAVRRHHPEAVFDGRGDHEAVLVAVDDSEECR